MSQTKRVNGLGQTVWTKAYASTQDPFGVSSVTDGNSRSWTYNYDSYGHVLLSRTPKSTLTTNTYSYANFQMGELTSTKTGTKTATSFTYNEPTGTVATVLTPIPGQVGTGNTQTTSYSYDSFGNLTQVLSPGNNTTTAHSTIYGYTMDGTYSQSEALGEPITVTDTLGKVTHLRYDSRRNLATETDAVGNMTTQTFNLADQEVTTTLPATGQTGTGNGTVTNSYLYSGGPKTQVSTYDESGILARTASYTYGPEAEAVTQSGDQESASYVYDAAYHLASLLDGNSHGTTYTYDLAGRVTKISYPGATGTNYDQVLLTSYDSVNNLLSRTDGNGQITNYTYADTDGLLSSIAYPGKTAYNVGLGYDSYDRLSAGTDASGSFSGTFDDLNLKTGDSRTYTGLSAQNFSYSYYPDGSRSSMVNLAGTWTYTYDADGRYSSLSSPAGTSSATYFDNGWQHTRTLPNGAVTNYSVNGLGMLTGLTNQTSGSTTLSSYGTFAYDGVANLTSVSASVPGASSQGGTTGYTFDAKDRMLSESSTRNGGYTGSFGYDPAGNPTTFKGASEGFNSDNQQTSAGTFVYDGNGNPTTYKGSAFAFDPENHLSTVGSSWAAGYRADGLRASKTVSGITTYYLYDGGEPIIELNSSGAVQAINVFADDGLVARKQSGTWTQYTFDQQGNVAQRLDSSQNVLSSSIFDAYGVESSSGSPNDVFGYNARYGYLLDRETGLYLCQHRYYDPSGGRWVNRDPKGSAGGINLYSYCGQLPLNLIDPRGLQWTFPDNPSGLPPGTVFDPTHGTDPGTCQRLNQPMPQQGPPWYGRYVLPGGRKFDFHREAPVNKKGTGDHWHDPMNPQDRAHYKPGQAPKDQRDLPGDTEEPGPSGPEEEPGGVAPEEPITAPGEGPVEMPEMPLDPILIPEFPIFPFL